MSGPGWHPSATSTLTSLAPFAAEQPCRKPRSKKFPLGPPQPAKMPVILFSGHPLSQLLLTGWAHLPQMFILPVQGSTVTYSRVCKTTLMLEAQLRSLYSAATPSYAEFKLYSCPLSWNQSNTLQTIATSSKEWITKTQQCKWYSLFRTITSHRSMHSNHSTALIACWLLYCSILTRGNSTYSQANSVKFTHRNIAQVLFQRYDIMWISIETSGMEGDS